MLALLITSALAASLLVELGLSVVRDLMEAQIRNSKMNAR